MQNNKTIVIIGYGGRLGRAVARNYSKLGYNIISFNRQQLDLSNQNDINKKLNQLDFDILFCSAAVTSVDYAEENPSDAIKVNRLAPKLLAQICLKKSAKLILVSTDYVLDGDKPGLKSETHSTNPLGVYAQSKLDGEKEILDISDKFLVIRTSWIFGPDRKSFIDMFIENAKKQEEVKVVSNKYSCPSYSEDLANYTLHTFDEKINGVIHLCNIGECSWVDFAQEGLSILNQINVDYKCKKIIPVNVEDFNNFKAKRPIYTAMSTEKFTKLTNVQPRHWKEALSDYLINYYKKSKLIDYTVQS